MHLFLAQIEQSKEHFKTAQQYFQVVGQSATECDTIPGRQCKIILYIMLHAQKLSFRLEKPKMSTLCLF